MSLLRREEINSAIEEKILIGIIVSDSFCRDITPVMEKDIFAVPYVAKVASWAKGYYKKYKKAPGAHIQDIFELERPEINEDERKAISMFLSRLSEDHEAGNFNEDYLKDKAFTYFSERIVKITNEKVTRLLEAGRPEEAEKVLQKYKKATFAVSGWENPFDLQVMRNWFADEQSKKNVLFQLPGDLGRFIGPIYRNWLLGILAPTKRGKTWWLMELAVNALFERKRTLVVSLEMDKHRLYGRAYRRMTALGDDSKEYIYPVFDCRKNQNNTCNNVNRACGVRLLDDEGNKPKFEKDMAYKACSHCRGTKDFEVESWFTVRRKEKMSVSNATKIIQAQMLHFGNNLRVKAYPAYSANLSRIKNEISMLIDSEGFVPDFIVIDYADILAPEDSRIVGRERIDETWKSLKGLSDELHCCVATASQANRKSFDKRNVVSTDASEDIRKIANSDLFLAINQTAQEKRESRVRISRIAVRDDDFDQYEGPIVLQQLALGQVSLDSYRHYSSLNKEISDDVIF